MCTALSYTTKDHYFGRNLDLDRFYGEEVCILPRRFPLAFRRIGVLHDHYAIIGMATVRDGTPLYYDAANERGLAMAGLNFPGNARYFPLARDRDNITPFEFIPWVLGQCRTVTEAATLLDRINLADIAFSQELPLAPLHWIISDRDQSLVVEPMKSGLHIYSDPVGVLTNNPPFPHQLANLQKYRHLRPDNAMVSPEESLPYETWCQGLGAVGLPGDVSSMSRFVQMVFGRAHSVCGSDESSSVSQFFHLLSSVEMIRGLCRTDSGTWDITGYSACINATRGRYYYTTYDNRRITCVDLHRADLTGSTLRRYPLAPGQDIDYQN